MDIINSISSKFYSPDTAINTKYLDPDYLFGGILNFLKEAYQTIDFRLVGNIINIIFFVVAIFSIYIICYCTIRIFELRKKEHEHLHHEIEEYAHKQREKEKKEKEGGSPQSIRWNTVLEHVNSSSSGDWKLAIIDADSMLEDLLNQLGFVGENLGEKLKSIDMSKYTNLKPAWDVHKVRNEIAHEGTQFEISQEEAKRVISTYEQIFKDFRYI